MVAVTEPGLYRLIFRSDKPKAEEFRRWVFHEVLPEIRKTGGYQVADRQRVEVEKLSIWDYLWRKYPGRQLNRKAIERFGCEVRKMAKALGVVSTVGEDSLMGEALIWPVPLMDLILQCDMKWLGLGRPVSQLKPKKDDIVEVEAV